MPDPEVLRAPPWLAPKTKAPPPLELEPPAWVDRVAMEVHPGRGAQTRDDRLALARENLAAVRGGGPQIFVSTITALPDDEALAAWSTSDPAWFHGGDYDGRSVYELVQRLGVAAIEGLVRYAEGKLPSAVPALVEVISPRVAPFIAMAFAFGKKTSAPEQWLLAYPEVAAAGLVPTAVGREKKKREAAAAALRLLAGTGHRAVVESAAAAHGPEVHARVEALLRDDLPARIPEIPEFVVQGALPPVVDRAGETISATAREHLLRMLVFTPIVPRYSGLAQVEAACDPTSLREFAWTLFEQWAAADHPVGHEWAMFAVGHLGDDVAVERLVPRLARWQSGGAALRVAKAVDVIALVGTPLAFAQLDQLARKSRFPLLRDAARAAVARVARRLGIHPDELEDRAAPELDLDADGSMSFATDGGETWRVTLDESLTPMLIDPNGRRAKSVPKALGPTAASRYKALCKGAKLTAAAQIARFERAMITERSWAPAVFREIVIDHPVLRHLARRLVWLSGDTALRVAEDGTLADADDREIQLDPDRPVRVAHPLRMTESTRQRFGRIFGDYEILQPFEQLTRATHRLADTECVGDRLVRFEGRTVGWEQLASLERHGFRDASHGSTKFAFTGHLPFGVTLCVLVAPGIDRADPRTSGPQVLGGVQVGGRAVADLSVVERSEVLQALSPLE